MEDVTLYNLIEMAIACEYGKTAVIPYRKLKSVVATNRLVIEHETETAKLKKKSDFVKNHPHLFK